jgi:hypothetical protein
LAAVLGFPALEPREPELRLLHRWLDSWRAVDDVRTGMMRLGWDVQLAEYDAAQWRATFFVASHAHSILGGSAWETTLWRAAQRAAWETFAKAEAR